MGVKLGVFIVLAMGIACNQEGTIQSEAPIEFTNRPTVSPSIPNVVICVPDVVGMPAPEARTVLNQRGLRVTGDRDGYVVSQNPSPGTEVRADAQVELILSSQSPSSSPSPDRTCP